MSILFEKICSNVCFPAYNGDFVFLNLGERVLAQYRVSKGDLLPFGRGFKGDRVSLILPEKGDKVWNY